MPLADDRLAVTVPEAARISGLGRTKLYELFHLGRVETALVGRRRLVLVESLEGFLRDCREGG